MTMPPTDPGSRSRSARRPAGALWNGVTAVLSALLALLALTLLLGPWIAIVVGCLRWCIGAPCQGGHRWAAVATTFLLCGTYFGLFFALFSVGSSRPTSRRIARLRPVADRRSHALPRWSPLLVAALIGAGIVALSMARG
jgi:hypothetical protein